MSNAPTRKQLLTGGGHLAAVWTLAFVQPLLDLLGRNPDFFVARDNTSGDVLILALAFTLLPPLGLLVIEWATSKVSARAYNWLHLALLAGISTFLFIRLISTFLDRPTGLILLLAAALGVLLAWAVFRFTFARNLMDILIVAPLVVLGLFIFVSPAREVIFPGKESDKLNAAKGENRPIVLVIFDELGTGDLMADRDTIDAERFPEFARLAREATWYRNQSTTSPFTPQAVPGILTGQALSKDVLPASWNLPDNIFTLLGRDRNFHVMEDVTKLCPVALCPQNRIRWRQLRRLNALWSDLKYVEGRMILPPGLADRLPEVDGKFQDFGNARGDANSQPFRKLVAHHGRGGGNAATVSRFIRDIPDGRRGLTVMHLALPHHEWRYAADGRSYNWKPLSELGASAGEWGVDSNGIASAQARMYVQTGFADRLVGELRRSLERKGLWDDAVVVISADHGLSFEGGDVPRRVATRAGVGEIGNPPLFIKYPGQRRGRTVTAHSTTLDILPTIARAVGVKPTYRMDGVPLQRRVLPDRPVTLQRLVNDPVTITVEEMVAQRNAAIGRARKRLGGGPLYTLGPAPNLIGRRVPPVPATADSAVLDARGIWRRVRPAGSPVPINVTGRLPSGAPGTVLAIAVNGVIRGTAGTFEHDGAVRFGGLIDPASLVPGANRIGIYMVEGKRLAPLGDNRR